MSKRCPDCGFINEDSRIYCASCGELLDSDLRLIKNLERQATAPRKAASEEPRYKEESPAPKKTDDGDYNVRKVSHEKKSSPAPWIILGVAALAVIVFLIVNYAL